MTSTDLFIPIASINQVRLRLVIPRHGRGRCAQHPALFQTRVTRVLAFSVAGGSGTRSSAHARGLMLVVCGRCLVINALVRQPGGRPRMGPAIACPSPLPSHRTSAHAGTHLRTSAPRGTPPSHVAGWRWCLRAQAPFAVASRLMRQCGDEATALKAPWPHPASVGRRTQVPPLPCSSGLRPQCVACRTGQTNAINPPGDAGQRPGAWNTSILRTEA